MLGKGQEVTRLLTDAGIPVLQHRDIFAISQVYEACGVSLGRSNVSRAARPGWAVVVPPGTRRLERHRPPGPHRRDRLGHRSAGQVSARRRPCDPAFGPCRLRRAVRGGPPRRSPGDLLHARAGEFCRASAMPATTPIPWAGNPTAAVLTCYHPQSSAAARVSVLFRLL